jgi:hypothetical protein
VGVLVFSVVVGAMALEVLLYRLYLPPPHERPSFEAEPRVLLVHRVLWLSEDGGPMEVERLGLINVVRMLQARPAGGARLADRLSALSRDTTGMSTFDRVASRLALTVWISRRATAEQLVVAVAEKDWFGEQEGLVVAARYWFDRSPEALTVAQAAVLAGLSHAPWAYNPACNPSDALSRRTLLLARLEAKGLISSAERSTADAEPLALAASAQCVVRAH